MVHTILDRAQSGTRVVYLPGNHDTGFRQLCGVHFGTLEVSEQAVHTTASGEQFLVLHGDVADAFVKRHQWIARFGAELDSQLRRGSNLINRARRHLGMPPQTAVEQCIARFNALIRHDNRFEARLVELARAQGCDGVICGHFHKPALHQDFGLTYANCGDWVENFSALAEDQAGNLRLLGNIARALTVARSDAPEAAEDVVSAVS